MMKPTIPGPLSEDECAELARCAAESGATRALELGHYLGLSTAILLGALPDGCSLTTIDHHAGDDCTPRTSSHDFIVNMGRYIQGRRFEPIFADLFEVLPELEPGFDFVFYDADHSAEAVTQFWKHALPLLADGCTLTFDDADWGDQAKLRKLAEADGFQVVRTREFYRDEDEDKREPTTYTLEVMVRS